MKRPRKAIDLRKSPIEAYRSRYPMTRFGVFMADNWPEIKALHLADEVGISRQHIYRLRYNFDDPTLTTMLLLRDGCSRLLGRHVWLSELFELGEDRLLGGMKIRPLDSQIG